MRAGGATDLTHFAASRYLPIIGARSDAPERRRAELFRQRGLHVALRAVRVERHACTNVTEPSRGRIVDQMTII